MSPSKNKKTGGHITASDGFLGNAGVHLPICRNWN